MTGSLILGVYTIIAISHDHLSHLPLGETQQGMRKKKAFGYGYQTRTQRNYSVTRSTISTGSFP
jgi:hypothetical protein